MRHCVSTYEDQVRHGDNCFVSVRYRGKRAATALIHGPRERATISQLRGPCNSRVHKNVERAVHRWLRPTFHRAKAGSDIEVDIGLDEEFYEISL